MLAIHRRTRAGRVAAIAAGTVLAVIAAGGLPAHAADDRPIKRPKPVAGANAGTAGLKTFASQEAVARLAPYGSVDPGEYGEALGSLRGLPSNSSRWREITNQRYDSNDPNYRDPVFSNSGAGWGDVAGRITGLADGNRVGGQELESRSINQLKLDGAGNIYAATSRGLYKHSVDARRQLEAWQRVFLPNPASDSDITKPYDNIINDVVIQPGTGGRVVLANAAWRSGAAYNGFYLSTNSGRAGSFAKVAVAGVNDADVGNAEFAVSGDGKQFYMVLESPAGLVAGKSALGGVYTARRGVTGPWTKIADSPKLLASGYALDNSY